MLFLRGQICDDDKFGVDRCLQRNTHRVSQSKQTHNFKRVFKQNIVQHLVATRVQRWAKQLWGGGV